MFSRSPKVKGKESSGESYQSSSDSSGQPTPTNTELEYAITTISWALGILGLSKFGFIGGGAVSVLSSQYGLRPRKTDDVDVLIQPTRGISAYEVSQALTTNEALKGCFVARDYQYEKDKPHVVVTRQNGVVVLVPIEIFDWQSWPRRQQYYNLDLDDNSIQYFTLQNREAPLLNPGCDNSIQYFTLQNRDAPLLNPGWLLRQKILSYNERQGKSGGDMVDIGTLREVLLQRRETITITDEYEVGALKTVLDNHLAPVLEKCVLCEAIWPTK